MLPPLQCPPVAVAIAKLKKEGDFENVANKIEFNVVELSDLLGWDSGPVKKELKLLEWNLGRSSLLAETVPFRPLHRCTFLLETKWLCLHKDPLGNNLGNYVMDT